jgi:hypothetical protein
MSPNYKKKKKRPLKHLLKLKMLKSASKYLTIPAHVMKIFVFHYGCLKKAEIPYEPCRKTTR